QQLRLGGDVHAILEDDALISAGRHQISEIALERPLARGDALEQGRLAGEAEGAARHAVLLEHRHAIAIGNKRRIGEARRAGADHGDTFPLRRIWIGEAELPPGGAVDDAADAGAATHLIDASVAGEAATGRLAAAKLLDPL